MSSYLNKLFTRIHIATSYKMATRAQLMNSATFASYTRQLRDVRIEMTSPTCLYVRNIVCTFATFQILLLLLRDVYITIENIKSGNTIITFYSGQ